MNSATQQGSSEGAQGQLNLQRIYLKDLSFETPNAPDVFKTDWKPKVHLEFSSSNQTVEGDLHEVTLALTVTAKNDEKTAFIVEVKQAGLFALQGFSKEQLPVLLGSYCPSILYPYAREVISDVVGKGSFPQLLLAPINFDALYAKSLEQQAQQQTVSKH